MATTAELRVREDFIDFPTGWAIQNAGLIVHTDDRCSAVQSPAFLCDCDGLRQAWQRQIKKQQEERDMFVSEDGTVTGSIDVARLGEVKAKSDEAKAQLKSLQAEVQAGAEQAERDAERASQGERALGINSTGRDDGDADDRAAAAKAAQADAERQQREADAKRQAEQAAQAEREQADAKAAKTASTQKRG